MASKKKSKGNKRESQSNDGTIPTLAGAVEGLDRAMRTSSRAPVPRRRKNPGITPKFRKLR